MKRSRCGALGLFVWSVLVLAGCGSDGSSGNSAAVQTACNGYCDTYAAASCSAPVYASAAECKTGECAPLTSAPAGCHAALKTYYDCRKAQSDICADEGCVNEFAALASCR